MHTSMYLSPASLLIPTAATGPDSFEGFPPTYVVYGGAERLARSIGFFWSRLQVARKAESMHKLPVTEDRLVEGPDSVHDFMIFPWQSEEAAVVYADLDGWLRDLLASEDEPSAEEVASPDWKDIALRRQESRKAFMKAKSPRMGPVKDDRGVLRMIGDMGDEGLKCVSRLKYLILGSKLKLSSSMIDIPPLDLDGSTAKQWLTPFTAQAEKGEWDWEERGPAWYEMERSASLSGSDSEDGPPESRKER